MEEQDEFLTYEKTWTTEELSKDIDEMAIHPLCITDTNKIAPSPEVEALQSLVYEDEDPHDLLEGFYLQGNKILKEHIIGKNPDKKTRNYFLHQALFKYNEAVEQNVKDGYEDIRKKLYCNRAFIHLQLKNWGYALKDCDSAIDLDPKYDKAYYRKATALFNLNNYEESLKICDTGISQTDSRELKNFRKKVKGKIDEIALKRAKEELKKKIEDNSLLKFLQKNDVLYSNKQTLEIPKVYKPIAEIVENKLEISVIFIYPEFGQFDFIERTSMDDKIIAHFATVYQQGLPWDEKKEYTDVKDIGFYVECHAQSPINKLDYEKKNKSLVDIGLGATVMEAIKTEGYVIPLILEVIVLSKKSGFFNFFQTRYN